MTDSKTTLPSAADKAAELVKQFIENELGGDVRLPLLISFFFLEKKAAEHATAVDCYGNPCLIGINELYDRDGDCEENFPESDDGSDDEPHPED